MGLINFRGTVDDAVTKKIEVFRWPTEAELYKQARIDDPIIPLSFALMYATSYGNRDKANAHAAAHYNDAANVVNVRPDSGIKFSAKKIAGALHHDGPEDEGEILAKNDPKFSYAAALVVIDAVHHLLNKRTGVDYAQLL